MKKVTLCKSFEIKLLFLLLFIYGNGLFAQCPPDNFPSDYVFLLTQEDVDNFLIEYPNCKTLQTLIIGDIIPSTITNLNGLINLESVGWLQITNIPSPNLQGLNNLHTVGRFVIYYMPELLSLEGLGGLETLTGPEFRIELCSSITDLYGLENLSTFEGDFFKINGNENLNDSSGLDCYFFTEEFRNNVSNYTVQESLYPSIFDNCGILILSNRDFNSPATSIYPNPAKDFINIDSVESINRIDIFDMFGRLVRQVDSNVYNVDVSDLKVGTYVLNIKFHSGVIRREKLIVD